MKARRCVNTRPISENPIGLTSYCLPGWVPDGGFCWVSGRRSALSDRFLIPNATTGSTPTLKALAADLANVPLTEDGVLGFANIHGSLGTQVHFHYANRADHVGRGESLK